VSRWERVDEIADRIEGRLLVFLLTMMIGIAFLQVLLRNLFSTGLPWGDPLVRNLVLWTGFIGAALATREGKHINIDLLSRWVPAAGKKWLTRTTNGISALVCGFLTYGTFKFIRNEALSGDMTFLGIPIWVPELILPVSLTLMTLRFILRCFLPFSSKGEL
jgi:TRAP-type C4-dicarboxylate transport system permease small subunit